MFSRIIREEIREDLSRIAEKGGFPRLHPETLDIGSRQYIDYFEKEILDETAAGGGGTCRFYIGSEGSGKSHLLNLMRRRALQKGYIVVYIEPGQGVGLDSWQELDAYIFTHMEMLLDGRITNSLPQILKDWTKGRTVDTSVVRSLKTSHSGFRNGICHVIESGSAEFSPRDLLWRYLCGERINASDMENRGFTGVKPPLSARNAEQVIRTVLMCLHAIGIPGVVLIFDEPDHGEHGTPGLTGRRLSMASQLIRRLVDGSINDLMPGCVCLFAVNPPFLQRCFDNYPALEQRILMPEDFERASWRKPLCRLAELNLFSEPGDFNRQASLQFEELLWECGVTGQISASRLEKGGQKVIRGLPNHDSRRALMEYYAREALKLIDKERAE